MARKKQEPEPLAVLAGFKQDVIGVLLIAFAIFSFASIFYSATGLIGFYVIKLFLSRAFGLGVYFFPFFIAMLGITTMINQDLRKLTARIVGLFLLFFVFISFAQVYSEAYFQEVSKYFAGAGGLFGYLLRGLFERTTGMIGTYIILIALTFISFLLITQITAGELFRFLWQLIPFDRLKDIRKKEKKIKNIKKIIKEEDQEKIEKETKKEKGSIASMMPILKDLNTPPEIDIEEDQEEVFEVKKTRTKSDYILPPVDLLDMPSEKELQQAELLKKTTEMRKEILEEALASFGVKASVVDINIGPAVTRFELQPEPGVKVSKIVNLADDIALNLASQGVRIEAPVPGKNVVGIEVPNSNVTPVRLGQLVRMPEFQRSTAKIPISIGKDLSGNPVIGDLTRMPHLLIAGTTGAGKSVAVNSMIASILLKAHPDEVKFIMIDPKMVELSGYNDIPHLVAPVVTDTKKAAATLKTWVMHEMDRRYKELFASGVRNIEAYNRKIDKFEGSNKALKDRGLNEEESLIPERMPYLVVIIDELADLMLAAAAEVEMTICRLAQMARATGIHLVVATQRPSVDIITGLIKANIPSRVSFAVATQIDSRVILDSSGAEKLLGRGDMLYHPIGAMKPLRVQGSFVTDQEIERLIDHVKRQAEPEYENEILEIKPELVMKDETASAEKDELFSKAAELVVETGQASTSHLQRRFRIGYNRAARIMDDLEDAGVVSTADGDNKGRRLLMTREMLKERGIIPAP